MRLIGMGLLAAAASLDVTMGFQGAGGVRAAGGWGKLGGRRAVCSPTVVHATAPPPVATGGGGGSDDDKNDGGGADISRPWPAKSERSMDYSLMKGEVISIRHDHPTQPPNQAERFHLKPNPKP